MNNIYHSSIQLLNMMDQKLEKKDKLKELRTKLFEFIRENFPESEKEYYEKIISYS